MTSLKWADLWGVAPMCLPRSARIRSERHRNGGAGVALLDAAVWQGGLRRVKRRDSLAHKRNAPLAALRRTFHLRRSSGCDVGADLLRPSREMVPFW